MNFCVLEIHADAQRVTTPMLGGCAWSALSCHFCYLAQIFRWPCHTLSASIKTKILRYLVRPILMQLDSQSVEKVPFSTFVRAFAPKIKGIGLSRLRMSRSFLQDLSRVVSRSPGAQLQEITVRTFSIQLGQIRLQLYPIGLKKNVFSIRSGVVIILDPLESKKC